MMMEGWKDGQAYGWIDGGQENEGRNHPAMAFVASAGRMLVVGGANAIDLQDTTLQQTATGWTAAVAPPPERLHAMAHDPVRGRTVAVEVPTNTTGVSLRCAWSPRVTHGAGWAITPRLPAQKKPHASASVRTSVAGDCDPIALAMVTPAKCPKEGCTAAPRRSQGVGATATPRVG